VIKVASLYGQFIWLVMSLVVIPVLVPRPPIINFRWLVQLIAHIPFVAIPMAWSIAKTSPKTPSATEARVKYRFVLKSIASVLPIVTLATCAGSPAPGLSAKEAVAPGRGLVLQINEGERRVRRNAGKGPFILKVDRQNGGSPDLVMGYEDLAPGVDINLHRHLVADEILFIHTGSGIVTLDGSEHPVSAGTTVYIPRNVSISARNTGSVPLGLAFIFSKPGFEELMRENSVLEGQPVTPMSAEERDRIRERHKWHTVYPPG
jgi:quercetin dioxygenase-like cupin family protein